VDGTGSMSALLAQVKATINTVFHRAIVCIMAANNVPVDPAKLPEDCEVPFQLQIGVYRDYDQGINNILRVSDWETRPQRLGQFLEREGAQGGGDYEEAIEVGFEHAVKQADDLGLDQIILIADAPAKELPSINDYRQRYGPSEKWSNAGFAANIDFRTEMEKLRAKEVVVHTFRLTKEAELVANFNEIHELSYNKDKATNIFLDLSVDSDEKFMEFFTKEIVNRAAGDESRGEEARRQYDRLLPIFRNSYRTSHI
jgi:hypothetical protein